MAQRSLPNLLRNPLVGKAYRSVGHLLTLRANGRGLNSEVIYPALSLGIFLRFRCHCILRVLNPIVYHLAESGVEAVITSVVEYRYVCLLSCDVLRGKHGGQCTSGPAIVSVGRPTDGHNISISLIDLILGMMAWAHTRIANSSSQNISRL